MQGDAARAIVYAFNHLFVYSPGSFIAFIPMSDSPALPPCLLYLISPPRIPDLAVFASELEYALSAGGVGAFQLRLKNTEMELNGRLTYPRESEAAVLRAAEALMPICREHNVAFILNDDPKLARDCGADGVHLGQEDGSVQSARTLLGEEVVIGVSCHDSRHLAMVAGEDGADYVAFGAFYPTASKTEAAQKKWGTPPADILTWWAEVTTLPCVAIGGITPQNCAPLVRAGADFIAAISYVWHHPDGAKAAVQEFGRAIEGALPNMAEREI